MSQGVEYRPPCPPFDRETAIQKVRGAEDGWNTRDPERVSLAYAEQSRWRNRSEFMTGRTEIVAFLRRKWSGELDYRLIKELWAFTGNRIAVRFAYEWHDASGNWFRSYGNENWEFADNGLMAAPCLDQRPVNSRRRTQIPLAARTPPGRPPRLERPGPLAKFPLDRDRRISLFSASVPLPLPRMVLIGVRQCSAPATSCPQLSRWSSSAT